MRQIVIAVTTFTTCWGLSLYRLLFLLMSCTAVFLKMWHLHHAEMATLGELGSLVTTRLHHLCSLVHHCSHCSIKRHSKGGWEAGDLLVCLPARIKWEPSLSTSWVITQVVVDLHLFTFCCRRHWLPSHKSGKVQCLTLSPPLPCLFCNSDQSLEVSIELVYCFRCCQNKWVMGKIKDIWSQEALVLAYCLSTDLDMPIPETWSGGLAPVGSSAPHAAHSLSPVGWGRKLEG